MKLKPFLRLILLMTFVFVWLVSGISIHAQSDCDTSENLLGNCGFESGFRLVQGANPRNVALAWQPWNAPRTSDMPTYQNTQPTYFAGSNASGQGAIPHIRNGNEAQVYFSFFETHDGGIYQHIPDIPLVLNSASASMDMSCPLN